MVDRVLLGGRFDVLSDGGSIVDLVGAATGDEDRAANNYKPIEHSSVGHRAASLTRRPPHVRRCRRSLP